jgi:hypothetical protein
MDLTTIQYIFVLSDEKEVIFEVKLDNDRIVLVDYVPDSTPGWTNLEFQKCPNCTLNIDEYPACPAALNLVNAVQGFGDLASYSEVLLRITIDEKIISTQTTVQRGLRSLMGLLLATSACPHTEFLKPMARFHLPLASQEETFYRATSMYLLAQYFLRKEGHNPDFEMEKLKALYQNLQVVNMGLANRIRSATKEDSAVNAIILLDTFAVSIPVVIEESLDQLRYLFQGYFRNINDKTEA